MLSQFCIVISVVFMVGALGYAISAFPSADHGAPVNSATACVSVFLTLQAILFALYAIHAGKG